MHKYHKIFLWLVGLLFAGISYGQDAPGSPNVIIDEEGIIYNEALDRYELHLPCGVNEYDFTGTYNAGRQTDTYEVLPIPYEPPFPFTGGAGSTNITADDVWSNIIDLGDFRFCFFGKGYDKVLLNSNGAMTFDINGVVAGGRYTPSTGAGYSFSNPLPSDSQVLYVNAIFGVMQDTYPSHSFPGWSINYEIIGEEPYRTFVFNFYKMGLFSNSNSGCGNIEGEEQTYQMVLYEATNIIDIYVENRDPGTCQFNNASGLIGIQSRPDYVNGLTAYTPPERNTGPWSASNEAWRFRPSGPNKNSVKWYVDGVETADEAGSNFGASNHSVSFTQPETIVKFEVGYDLCSRHDHTGRPQELTIYQEYELHVFTYEGFDIDLGDDIVTCDNDPITLTPTLYDEDGNEITDLSGFEFEWSTGETTESIVVTESGVYTVTIIRDGVCEQVQSITVSMGEDLPVYTDIDDYAICEIEDGEAVFDLTSVQVINNPDDYTYEYYTSEADAEARANAIPVEDIEDYTSSGERIWVVITEIITDPNQPVCNGIAYFDLVVNPLPVLLQDIVTLVECEEEVGSGSFEFDLTDALVDFVADPSAYDIAYYSDAGLTTAVDNTTGHLASSGDIVYVKFSTDEGCEIVGEIHFSISSIPVVADLADYHLCDEGEGEASFDLASLISDIQDGNAWSVTFHTDQDAETDALTSPYTSESATIYVKVDDAGCYDILPLNLVVDPLPILVDDLFLEACANEDGLDVAFDLQELTAGLLAGIEGVEADYTLSFSQDEPNAEGNVNQAIAADVDFEVAATTTVWVKLENNETGCFSTTSVELIVNPLPTLLSQTAILSLCESGTGSGEASFDITTALAQLVADVDAYDIAYYSDAALTAAITNTENHLASDGDVVYIEFTTEHDCSLTAELTLFVTSAPDITIPAPLHVCDNGEGEAVFDLGAVEAAIHAEDASLVVSFHSDAAGDSVALPMNYTSSTTTIYIKVAEGDCVSIVPLSLVVDPLPQLPASVSLQACASDDGLAVGFDLLDADLQAAILVHLNAEDYTIEISEDRPNLDGETNSAIDLDVDPVFSTTSTVRLWVKVTNDNTNCFSVTPLDLIINPLPVTNEPDALLLQTCATGATPGIGLFDLDLISHSMVGGSNFSVYYYEVEDDAIDARENEDYSGSLDTDYENTTPNSQTLYVLVVNNRTGCSVIVQIELEVFEAPEAHATFLEVCDVNNDGEVTFHLPGAIDAISQEDGVEITFHLTQADAQNNANPLADDINNNILVDGQFVYARVFREGLECISVVAIELIVYPTPDLVQPLEPAYGCDRGDGAYVFDLEEELNLQDAFANINIADFDFAYFVEDEDGERSPINNPNSYASQGGIVYIVVTNPITGCFTEISLELVVNELPEFVHPIHYELCDVNNPGDEKEIFYWDDVIDEITDGDASLAVSFHLTQEDANTGANPIESGYENTENNQTIFIRIENEWGCTVSEGFTLTLVVNPLPAPKEDVELEVCDVDSEGYAYFDLSQIVDEIIDNEPDVSLEFFETYTDAENDRNPIENPENYQNIVAGEQIIYARVTNDDTGCFTIVEVVLKALESPVVPIELDDLYYCAGDLSQGVRVDLRVYEELVFGDQNTEELVLTYHESEGDARGGTAAIIDVESYLVNPPSQEIWIRLANGATCYNVTSFTIFLTESADIVDPTPLTICTPLSELNTQTAVFNLMDKRAEILNGNTTGLGLYFYEDEADAFAGNGNYIQDPLRYENTSNPQELYVRVVNNNNSEDGEGCIAFTTLTIRVEPNPEPVTPDPIFICHIVDTEDFVVVDLTQNEAVVQNQEAWDLTYYTRYRDAVNGDETADSFIANPEAYELALEPNPATIYIRVTNLDSDCFAVVEQEVVISKLPLMVEDIEPLIVCTTDSNNIAEFDLTSKLDEIFGNQSLIGLDVFFYTSLEDAVEGNIDNAIVDPEHYFNLTSPQTIYVGVGNPEIDGCYYGGLTWFEIEVLDGALAFEPATYVVCGSGNYGVFDLTSEWLQGEILGPLQDPADFDISFYLTETDAESGTNAIADATSFYNTSNPQVIYARVTNIETGCSAVTQVTLEVETIADFILEDVYSICLDENGDPTIDEFGNVIYPLIDTGLNWDDYEFTWYYEGELIVGQVGPVLEATKVGTYTLELVSLITGCTLTKDIEVIASSAPFIYSASVVSAAFSGNYDIEVSVDGLGDYMIELDGGQAFHAGTGSSRYTFTNVGIGSHVVTIYDINGCGVITIVVDVVDYPKFFTPNDDGYNDTWNIPGLADIDPAAEIFIFDRHGKLLKQISPHGAGWDGSFRGKPMPATDYWFVVKYVEDGVSKEFKSHFSLKR